MSKRLFKTMVAVLAIAAAAAGPVRGQNASPDVTLDFTTNTWDIPAGKANITYAANSYTSGDYTITLQGGGGSSNGYYFNSDYLLLGKSGAYLQLPAFESAVDSIVVVGHSGASANVNQNIYVGETAVSTQTMGATETNTYVIDEDYRAAGNIYTLKVESGHNTQISYIKVYYASSGGGSTPEPEPEPAVPHSVRMAEGTVEAANWTLASGNASVPGTQVLEGVMSGSQLTATYNGDLKIKKVIATKCINPNTIPLTVEALTAGTVKVTAPKSGMKYSKNGGEMTALTTTITIDVVAGDKVAFYGSATSYNGTRISGGSADSKVYGNIMSLIDEENFATATTLTEANTFRSLFSSYSKLTDASGLLLPATTLASGCYYQMFSSCYGLTAGPELLPATELADVCYQQMFSNCTTLVAAPALPATTLAENCYKSMFYSCKSLTTAPALPATTLAPNCYHQMFGSCSNLTTAPELPATTLAPYCYQQMFSNCTTLVAAPALPATTLANYCYAYMFYSCSNLTTAPALPATELANDCYQSMFSSCYSLAAAPELPATTMAPECYTTMFYNCTTLTAVPVLPATTLATYCYNCMFQGCTGLTTVPSELLPATTLADYCYYGMFQGCTNLTTGPELPATTLTTYCYGDMFRNCSNLANVTCLATSGAGGNNTNRWLLDAGTQATGTKTFTAAAAATWPEGVNGIPTGWTRLNPDGSEYVAPAATVTTAPTATEAIIEVGSTAALVNAGAANGGTMMYAVTTTNAQPASTADFSASVPTAEGREAGTYYVWFYAKADANHSDSEIAGPVSVTVTSATTTVTWNSTNVFNSDHWMDELSQWNRDPLTYEGITISFSGDDVSTFSPYDHSAEAGRLTCFGEDGDSFTFTAPDGKKFCKIEIIDNMGISFDEYGDWTEDVVNHKIVWSGTAASTVTLGSVFTAASRLNSIVFKLIDD